MVMLVKFHVYPNTSEKQTLKGVGDWALVVLKVSVASKREKASFENCFMVHLI